jgi:hypothetical protein
MKNLDCPGTQLTLLFECEVEKCSVSHEFLKVEHEGSMYFYR